MLCTIKNSRKVLLLLIAFLLASCATYYQKSIQFHNYVAQGDYVQANKFLDKDKRAEEGINRVLFFMNKGLVNYMLGNYETSNYFFDKADLYNEDFTNNLGTEALALISNPMVKPYKPEDFETVMVHYYKALNYLMLENYEDALVECRRVNIQLQVLNDKYKKTKNKYSNDAFAHNLMGMIYEASGDINNAFIAYRNAYNTYENDYKSLFGLSPPLQLKKDLIRVAYKTGFIQEYDFYCQQFNMRYSPDSESQGSLVFLWMNGFGPVKAEWSITLTNTGYNDGWITFSNEDYGFNFPVYIGNKRKREQSAFKDISFLRIAFPKYIERKPYYQKASLAIADSIYPLEISQNINAIAFQSLKDRMIRELAYGVARLATKKALEALANKKDDNLGTVISIINAITEKADTRNWQTLPYAIHYTRIPLNKGIHNVNLLLDENNITYENFQFQIKKGKTTFFTFQQQESVYPNH
jgi:hypothetical protein